MDISPYRLLQLLLPRTPLILKTIVLSKLSRSTNSDRQDTQTEVVTLVIRSILGANAKPLKVLQDGSVKDHTIKGPMWIAKVSVPAPAEVDVRDLVLRAVEELGDGTERFALPDVVDVGAEWTGFRDCGKKTPRLTQISEREQYGRMMEEVTSDATVLYFHGGAYIMMDPASHRGTTAGLAKKTGGRCFSVRYRLAPQNAFPAQLIDGLMAYLYLQFPPEGAFHDPVSADKIVFAGDSAGGNLSVSLLLLLLTLHRTGIKTVRFHGRDVPIKLPAGIAGNSPWTDISRSLPTIYNNARFDYLDPPNPTGIPVNEFPADEIWPATPPRAEMYCTASLLTHPLASPVLATPEMWHGSPPAFMCCGNEGLEDEITVTARRMYLAGAAVEFLGYEGMPHCFAMVFPHSTAGRDCFDRWARFVVDAAAGKVQRHDTGRWMKAFSNPPEFRTVDLAGMGLPDDEVTSRIQKTKATSLEREQDKLKAWEQQDVKARL